MAELILSDFDRLEQPWQQIFEGSERKLLFSSPSWSRLWWEHFGAGSELYLASVVDHDETIGIAPLRLHENKVKFIGSDDVCDFLDFVVKEGWERPFFDAVLDHLIRHNLTSLELSALLPDSATFVFLPEQARINGLATSTEQIDVTVELQLPGDLATYLSNLKGKQRHEILRKERRLNEEGEISFSVNCEATSEKVDLFLRFFRESREDKERFLSDEIEAYFRDLIALAARQGMLRLGTLEINNVPVAITLCFDYQNDVYLYNSSYDPNYRWLSVGILSKYFCIKHCIESGKQRFDFLKGDEKYKFHLGGREVPLYRCVING